MIKANRNSFVYKHQTTSKKYSVTDLNFVQVVLIKNIIMKFWFIVFFAMIAAALAAPQTFGAGSSNGNSMF